MKGRIRKLLIRLLIGKLIVVSNIGGVPTGAEFWSCIPVGKEVLLINTWVKPHAEPAK